MLQKSTAASTQRLVAPEDFSSFALNNFAQADQMNSIPTLRRAHNEHTATRVTWLDGNCNDFLRMAKQEILSECALYCETLGETENSEKRRSRTLRRRAFYAGQRSSLPAHR